MLAYWAHPALRPDRGRARELMRYAWTENI